MGRLKTSRNTFNANKNYDKVWLQPGVIAPVDYDWNEMQDIQRWKLREFIKVLYGDNSVIGKDNSFSLVADGNTIMNALAGMLILKGQILFANVLMDNALEVGVSKKFDDDTVAGDGNYWITIKLLHFPVDNTQEDAIQYPSIGSKGDEIMHDELKDVAELSCGRIQLQWQFGLVPRVTSNAWNDIPTDNENTKVWYAPVGQIDIVAGEFANYVNSISYVNMTNVGGGGTNVGFDNIASDAVGQSLQIINRELLGKWVKLDGTNNMPVHLAINGTTTPLNTDTNTNLVFAINEVNTRIKTFMDNFNLTDPPISL